MNSTFCGLCKHYQALPIVEKKMLYPWGGYDIFYIEEGMCSKENVRVNAMYEAYCKNFCSKEEYANERNENHEDVLAVW